MTRFRWSSKVLLVVAFGLAGPLLSCKSDVSSGEVGDGADGSGVWSASGMDAAGGLDVQGPTNPEDVPLSPPPDDEDVSVASEVSEPAVPGTGEFGAPCNGNTDCFSGWCVESEAGYICSKTCETDCPDTFDCRSVLSGADAVFLCMPTMKKVCTPCLEDFQCTGGACLSIDGFLRCAYPCTDEDPCKGPGLVCAGDPDGEKEGAWCQPITGSCECTAVSEGTQRTCIQENQEGACYGIETCDPEQGWVGCNAAIPSEEVCDGMDNNCNALLDEGVQGGESCSVDVEGVGSCAGVEVCLGAQGMICQAGTPALETCDFQDNDCDGSVDEDFKDEAGEWTLTEHCGTCGNECTDKIPHGTGTCAAKEGTPICVVESCDDDYMALNDFQCALPPDVSCQPCGGDEACYGGSCIALDGQQVCVSPCGEEGDTCADGYECTQLFPGLERCLPITESCVCSEATDGQTRTCASTNEAGICFGEETCDAIQGWGACTATVPSEEVCNGFDDNCNGAVDDGVVQPEEPCVDTNANGTCTGLWYCGGPEGDTAWWCSAPEPTTDVCDYLDNDCDGVADDPFKIEGTDAYVDDEHCGACGMACAGAIPHAEAHCVYNDGLPRCEVATCDLGFYQAGPLTCLPSNDTLCAPCQAADNCGTPGDACVPLDGAEYCGRDCSDDNLYGVPAGTCPPGFTCMDTEGGPQCQPDSGSCTCLPGDEGNVRTCSQETDAGLCFGQETCDPDVGWAGCTALVPEAEVCNQVDDDCDGSVDNVPGRGDVCENANELGTCSGLLDCVPGNVELVCVGATPAAESCDYVDNNCDGNTDEDFPLVYAPCAMGEGLCKRFGFHECSESGLSVFCNAEAGEPDQEVCDGLDNDCNGETDETWPTVGEVCYAGEGACQAIGIVACSGDNQGTECTAVPGVGGEEACNYVDDNCDGNTDEGYTNIATGLYESDEACGSCFTDCTKVYDKPNSFGFCEVQAGEPTCVLGCNPGYFDMNAIPDDGCEFFLDPTTIFVSTTDEHAWDDAGCGLGPWVNAQQGTWPCRSISHGIDRAVATGRAQVWVAGGNYEEQVTMVPGVDLLGGYNPITWGRSWKENLSLVNGPVDTGHRITVLAHGIDEDTVLQGFVIYGASASTAGMSSYGVHVESSTSALRVLDNVVYAGDGAPGNSGVAGGDGTSGTDAAPGHNAAETGTGACVGNEVSGGTAGTRTCGAVVVDGGSGGSATCPLQVNSPSSAQTGGAGSNGAASGGSGGWDGGTSAADACGVCSLPAAGMDGGNGSNGKDGASGTPGQACTEAQGSVVDGHWLAEGGAAGSVGSHGGGGGGGGAGGGGDDTDGFGGVCGDDLGASGGGGGSGACAGTGGGGGGGGGGSFGIFIVDCWTAPIVTGNTIYRGNGGQGGSGGNAGAGGVGGDGANGGVEGSGYYSFCTGNAGKGGQGGDGGHGGGGGGGCGGAAFGLWASDYGWGNPAYDNNTFPPSGWAGPGGQGGSSIGSSGEAGAEGASGDAHF